MLQTFVRSISDQGAAGDGGAGQAAVRGRAEAARQAPGQRPAHEGEAAAVGRTRPSIPRMVPAACVWRPGQQAAKPKQVTSDKDLASYVMRLNGVDSMEGLGQDQRKMVGDIVAIGENINRLNAGTPAGKMLTRQTWRRCPSKCVQGPRTLRLFRWRTETSALRCRTRARVRVLSMVPNQVQQMVAARLEGALSDAGGAVFGCTRRRRLPCRRYPRSVADAAPRASAREHSLNSASGDSAEGVQLDAARASCATPRRRAPVARQAPGLKAGAAARDRHAAEIAKAERDVELARTAERAAAERWSRATDGSPIARAAMGQTTAE